VSRACSCARTQNICFVASKDSDENTFVSADVELDDLLSRSPVRSPRPLPEEDASDESDTDDPERLSKIWDMKGLTKVQKWAIYQEKVRKRTEAELAEPITVYSDYLNDDGTEPEPEAMTGFQLLREWAWMETPALSRNFKAYILRSPVFFT
jgi:hypothetical protein